MKNIFDQTGLKVARKSENFSVHRLYTTWNHINTTVTVESDRNHKAVCY